MQQTILVMSGKKQAGKNTCYSCIRLWRPDAQEFSFADSLKRTCIDVLGLEEWQAFGTDVQKNTIVPHLLWENFPIPVFDMPDGRVHVGLLIGHMGNDYSYKNNDIMLNVKYAVDARPKTGPMTAREVLQFWGTEIFRKAYAEVWTDACMRKIRKSGCGLAIITDCRFINEVEAIHNNEGKVLRLTRVVYPNDKHPSETALDEGHFDQTRFDAILDNSQMSINEQCEALYGIMRRWGIVEAKSVQRMHV